MVMAALAPVIVLARPSLAQNGKDTPIRLETHADPFDYRSATSMALHLPLRHAARHWKLCAVFPHIKDEYWLSVAWGMTREAQRLGVGLAISETGGYRSVDTQAQRLRDCTSKGADAAILGTVSYDAPQMLQAIAEVSQATPVIAAVNDVASRDIAVKVGVSWREMGALLGKHLSALHPAGSGPRRAVLATGPKEAGWVSFLSKGLEEGLKQGAVQLVDTGWGDTDAQEQFDVAETLLERNPAIDDFIGSAPAVEAMVSIARTRPAWRNIAIAATYYTQAVRRGMKRGRISAAPFDDPALQGRLSIEYAVRAIEGNVDFRQIGPPVQLVTRDSLPPLDALAPADFRPVFELQ